MTRPSLRTRLRIQSRPAALVADLISTVALLSGVRADEHEARAEDHPRPYSIGL
ncbi:MAG: hypothetical protein RL722_1798 [Pseudomonadota bacterium]